MDLTSKNFKETLKENKVVLVDFWAEWCGPCRMLAPTIDELEKEYGEKAVIGKVNTMHESQLASQFGIRSIPTIIIFKDGEEKEQIRGMMSKSYYTDKLNYYLN
jgi:thioredoxin 1|tara:strand:+ start:2760 stop:3071 length:312 start_codon:yes stop_codon:yes gene_type:complete